MVSVSPFPNTKIQHVFHHGHKNNTAHLLRSLNWPFPSVVAAFELGCRIYATVILTMSNTCRSLRCVHLFLLILYLVLLKGVKEQTLDNHFSNHQGVWDSGVQCSRWWIRAPWASELPRELTNHPWTEFHPPQHLPTWTSNGQWQHPRWTLPPVRFEMSEGSADACVYLISMQENFHNKTRTPVKMTEFIMVA